MISLLLACGLMPFFKKVITKFSSTFCLEVFGPGIWKLALYITHSYLVSVYFLVNLTLNIYNLFATNSFINNSDANKNWRKSVSESKKRKVSDKINLTVFSVEVPLILFDSDQTESYSEIDSCFHPCTTISIDHLYFIFQ